MSEKRNVYRPVITVALIVINVLVLLAETLAGGSENSMVSLRFGALYVPYVVEKNEWWRLFTSMFIHFGLTHIASNMVSLYMVGRIVEAYYGKIRFLVIYLAAGLGGGLLTLVTELQSRDFSLTAGASGAIFGIMSAFVVFAVNPVTRRAFPIRRVIAGIFFALLPGFYTTGISVTAHIGGFIVGLILSFLLDPHHVRRINRKYHQ
ncbi:MAG: rhomboid family intramembrane serine protease [Lachnospiraceae bacterium]|nr:rhomboid family intramembrane serine protease [Lachnospiraceae bacterium]MDY3990777.1 rhomboid family intramembrane serine protease [Lachnospiraceae bacterium]